MEHRIPPEQVRVYRRTQRILRRTAEKSAPELFRWLGWSTALAAIQVVAIRTGSSWLKAVPFVLAFFISGRIQWFMGLKHPESMQRDGSLVVRVQAWRFLIIPFAWAVTWAVALGAADLIAKSDLLPERTVVEAKRADQATPHPRMARPRH